MDQIFGVEVCSDGIHIKQRRGHELVGFFHRGKVVDLRLNLVSVGVGVVDARRGPVVDAPEWLDAEFLALLIRRR